MTKTSMMCLALLYCPFAFSDSLSVTQGLAFLTDGDVMGDYVGWSYTRDTSRPGLSWGISSGLASGKQGDKLEGITILSAVDNSSTDDVSYSRTTLLRVELYGRYTPSVLNGRFWLEAGPEVSFSEHDSLNQAVSGNDSLESVNRSQSTQLAVSALMGGHLLRFQHLSVDLFASINGMRIEGPTLMLAGIQVGAHW